MFPSLLLAVSLAPQGPGGFAFAPLVTINEVAYDDVGQDDREFVELHNGARHPADIGGWTLRVRSSPGDRTVVIPPDTVMPPDGFYLLGHPGVPGADQVFPQSDFLLNIQSSVELVDDRGRIVDSFTYEGGDERTWPNQQIEGGPWWGQLASDHLSLQRKSDSHDTDDNGWNFVVRPRTPRASNNVPPMQRYVENADGPPQISLAQWDSTHAVPIRIDPTVANSNYNNQPIPRSPQGGNAIALAPLAGTWQHSMLNRAAVDKGVIEFSKFILPRRLPSRRYVSETFGFGTTGDIYGPARSNFPFEAMRRTRNGNTGVVLTWIWDENGCRVQLQLPGNGGGNDNINGYVPVYDQLELTEIGWYHVRLEKCGLHFKATITPPSGIPVEMDVQQDFGVGPGGVYHAVFRSVDPADAPPLVIDGLVVTEEMPTAEQFGAPSPTTNGMVDIGIWPPLNVGQTSNIIGAHCAPGQNAFVVVGPELSAPFDLSAIGGQPCSDLWVQILDVLATTAGPDGSISFPFPVPADGDLLGAGAAFQAVSHDPGLPFLLPFGTSAGLRGGVGNHPIEQGDPATNVLQGAFPQRVHDRVVTTPLAPLFITAERGTLRVWVKPPINNVFPFLEFRDYAAFQLPDGTVRVEFYRPGTYCLQLTTREDPTPVEVVVCVWAASGDGARPAAEGRYEEVLPPLELDLTIVEDPCDYDEFDDMVEQYYDDEVLARSPREAAQAICAKYTELGRPIHVNLNGHGQPGEVAIGAARDGSSPLELNIDDIGRAGTNTEEFIQMVRGKIDELTIFGCEVGKGQRGEDFLQRLADALDDGTHPVTVHAYDKNVCASHSYASPNGHTYLGSIAVVEGGNLVSRTSQ